MTEETWTELRSAWRSGESSHRVFANRANAARALRRARMERTGLVLIALAAIAGALWHAANPIEAALGLGMGVAIGLAWWVTATGERRSLTILAEPGERYIQHRAEILGGQIRSFRFVWVVIVLQLVFFVPWWLGGIPVHAREGFTTLLLFSLWIPLTAMMALVVWTLSRTRSAQRELVTLEKAAALMRST